MAPHSPVFTKDHSEEVENRESRIVKLQPGEVHHNNYDYYNDFLEVISEKME